MRIQKIFYVIIKTENPLHRIQHNARNFRREQKKDFLQTNVILIRTNLNKTNIYINVKYYFIHNHILKLHTFIHSYEPY
jgi:hypothetical protein